VLVLEAVGDALEVLVLVCVAVADDVWLPVLDLVLVEVPVWGGVTATGTSPAATAGSVAAPEACPSESPPQHSAEPLASSAQLV